MHNGVKYTKNTYKKQMQNLKNKILLQQVGIEFYSIIQNLGRFYAYDISRHCGFISSDWDFPENGLYEMLDVNKYFIDSDRKAYLVRVKNELAGFVLLNKIGTNPNTDWNVGEFFIIAKFQGKGVAAEVAMEIWNSHVGNWEVAVIPENIPAKKFWTRTIDAYTNGNYVCNVKQIDYDKHQSQRIIFEFQSTENSAVS